MQKTRISAIHACFYLLAMLVALALPCQAQITTAKVTGGTVQGVVKDGVASFKGIPFAAPPIGDLRWKSPQPVEPWTGILKAETYGPNPMQEMFLALLMGGSTNISEDCLYLNVWTPAKKTGEKLPVMVWIYGGAFMSGMTGTALYDGSILAQKGVLIVSIAYRVGPFGFLAHPELSKESGHGSGNYGLEDQIAGLQWVKRNIAQFGGDPSRVTLFGESAGGISVSMLTAVPAAKGLFQQVISQSGGSMTPIKHNKETGLMVPSLKLAEENGVKYLAKLGVRDIKSARALSAQAVQKGGAAMGYFWPVADGVLLRGDQYKLYQSGKFNDTPILIGSNSDEGALFVHGKVTPADFEKGIREKFGPAAEGILKVYPHKTEAEAFKSTKDIFRETAFSWNTWTWAKLHVAKSRKPTFVYYFDHSQASSPDGASHATDISYVFGNPKSGWGGGSRPEDLKMSDLMVSYWVNFATKGDPNGPGLPPWLAYDENTMNTLFFDGNPGTKPMPNVDKIKAFDAYFAWRRDQAGKTGLK